MGPMLDPTVLVFATVLLAVLFATAAVGKLLTLGEFVGIVKNYQILPERMAAPVAYVLPALEAAIAAGLLFSVTRPHAALAAMLLLAIFAAAMAANLARGRREIDCGCFFGTAPTRHRLSGWLVGRNAVLIGLAYAVVVGSAGVGRTTHWLDVVGGVAAAIVVLFVYLAAALLFSGVGGSVGATRGEQGHG
jgi:hypothetical protein